MHPNSYFTRTFNYWSSRGIPGPKPVVLLGTIWQVFTKSIPELSMHNYQLYGKVYGVFFGTRPMLVVADPELIKEINIRDFHNFVDHNDIKTGDPLQDRSLFNLMGDEWKAMRSVISPTFSSGKMRAMHPIITDCVHRLDQYLETKAINGDELDVKRAMGNLTMDVIASCAFGTQIDTHNDHKTHEFVENARQVIRGNWRIWLVLTIPAMFPKLMDYIKISSLSPSVETFFRSAVSISTIIARRKSEINSGKHKDYLQLILNAQNRSADNSEDQDIDDLNEHIFGTTDALNDQKSRKVDMTDDDVLASSFLFLVAGYETTATLLSHLIYELSVNEKCQQRLYEEINAFDGNYSYESIARMPFALMEAKTAVAHLITKYRFKRTANTAVPLKYKKFEFMLTTGDIHIGIEKR
ncbi:unnamed protein product [Medioppia subpectinata]|uniref:Cytochrome P450 n=1 Tax=Medioppia subpectinata TaxID=1979941 RepID=A0A7R9L6T2_9ACAR|nr:unnamed protein product [Medioppia subpectinata]CAG2116475.1 unnamed protein product [Medioppia subpectinata]